MKHWLKIKRNNVSDKKSLETSGAWLGIFHIEVYGAFSKNIIYVL